MSFDLFLWIMAIAPLVTFCLGLLFGYYLKSIVALIQDYINWISTRQKNETKLQHATRQLQHLALALTLCYIPLLIVFNPPLQHQLIANFCAFANFVLLLKAWKKKGDKE